MDNPYPDAGWVLFPLCHVRITLLFFFVLPSVIIIIIIIVTIHTANNPKAPARKTAQLGKGK